MSWIAELDTIRKQLYNSTQNIGRTDTNVTFIPYDRIQAVWAGERLDRFLRDALCDPDHGTDQAISDAQIREAHDDLLRMISLLVGIHWSDWSRFKEIFFLHPTAATERRDNHIKNLTYNDLKDDSFLGDTPFIVQFLQNRWAYIPIVLDGDMKESFEADTRLPLVRQDNSVRRGGSGEMTKEKIPPNYIFLGHLNASLGLSKQINSDELVVARKRFRSNGSATACFNEMRQLRFIQSSLSVNKRIVYPLAAVKIGTEQNIIMPWSDMDLEDYLNGGYRSMNPDSCLLQDLVKEAGQLAAALEFLHHGLQIRLESSLHVFQHHAIIHADFRPRNILVFKQSDSSTGTWAITDFGSSQQSIRSVSKERHDSGFSSTRNSYAAPFGGVYSAPDAHAHTRSDIWSFGCILVRVFYLGFEHSLTNQPEFDASRHRSYNWQDIRNAFFEGAPPALNHDVRSWIESLPTRYRQVHSIEFLTKMKDLLFSMLKIDLNDRPRAFDVRSSLHELYNIASGVAPESVDSTSKESFPNTPITQRRSSTSTRRSIDRSSDRIGVGVLVCSIESDDVENVRDCLRNDPDMEEECKGDRPLIHAIMRGIPSIVQALLDHKPDLDVRSCSSKGETPLHLATLKGDVEVVRVLIDALIQNGFQDSLNKLFKDKTPLMVAALEGHVAVVSLLLDKHADTTICTGENREDCLHHAVRNINAQEDLIRAFVGKMDFNQAPEGYETPLMKHISLGIKEQYGTSEVDSLWLKKFNVLIEGKGDVKRVYPLGSPLQLAIENGKVDIARALLRAGAPPPQNMKLSKAMRDMIRRESPEPVRSSFSWLR